MSKKALLVVDVQNTLVELHPYNEEQILNNIAQLITKCRENETEVIYVRHHSTNNDFLPYGSHGWQIYNLLSPKDDEIIIEKTYNSSFRETNLKEYLEKQDIGTLILVGMQTDYCIDATCKIAFEYGYKVLIPEETNTTFDNKIMTGEKTYEYFMYHIWNNRYAQIMSMEETIRMISDTKE